MFVAQTSTVLKGHTSFNIQPGERLRAIMVLLFLCVMITTCTSVQGILFVTRLVKSLLSYGPCTLLNLTILPVTMTGFVGICHIQRLF